MSLLLNILVGIAAVALGIWLGLPGKYEQSEEDIEKAMERGGARRNQVKRVPTPLDWLRKDKRGSDRRIEAGRRRFRTALSEKPRQPGGTPGSRPEASSDSRDSASGDE